MKLHLHSPSAIQAIHQFIEYQAIHNPNLPALEFHGDILTYKLLNIQANKLAHFLIRMGVQAETIVGISVKRSLNMVIGILAIWKAGGAYLPIDPEYPTHRIEYIFDDSAIQLLLTEQSLLEHLPPVAIKTICLDTDKSRFEAFSQDNPPCFLKSDNLAYLLYTSGSTGNPKGVMVSHANLIATYLGWQEIYNLTSQDCHLQMASFSFDVFAGDLLRALCSGAKLVICSKINLLRPEKLYNLIITQDVNCAEFVPTILRRLISYVKAKNKDFSFMRLLLCGSDSWTLGEYRNLKQFCGHKTRVINSYGLTEATIDSTWFEEVESLITLSSQQYVPIGKPFPHTQIYLLDENFKKVAKEEIGEIYIGGLGVARGYYNKPELNQERFIMHSFDEKLSVKLYKTGDQGRFLADGSVQFLGRKDNQIKLRGIRIELSEIECAINSFPSVKENIVILNEQEPSHPRLVAYVVVEQEAKETLSELRHFLIENLPGYLIPANFVPLDVLPLTPNGKIDRENLKNRHVVFQLPHDAFDDLILPRSLHLPQNNRVKEDHGN
ncbi:non-ribosomal peptide synthetase [Legionella sp.]|uniref:non-ribosomal peptide synthetase n=1 Tax=Legionella sp. TaxID=459 RepID=UPI003CBB8A83